MASRLPMVPEGTKSAASLPNIEAARSSSSLTLGSSPATSSPTSARIMDSRIAGVGRVTVSDRKSRMGSMVAPFGGAPWYATDPGSGLDDPGVGILDSAHRVARVDDQLRVLGNRLPVNDVVVSHDHHTVGLMKRLLIQGDRVHLKAVVPHAGETGHMR